MAKREVVRGVVAVHREVADIGDPQPSAAAARDRVDARPVEIALYLLHQTGVGALAFLGLEDSSCLSFRHHDPVPHLAVHIQRVTAHRRPVGHRDRDVPLQVPWVGVVQHEGLSGFRQQAGHHNTNVELLKLDRLLPASVSMKGSMSSGQYCWPRNGLGGDFMISPRFPRPSITGPVHITACTPVSKSGCSLQQVTKLIAQQVALQQERGDWSQVMVPPILLEVVWRSIKLLISIISFCHF